MHKTIIDWSIIQRDTERLSEKIVDSGININLIVALLRGGTIPATILSHKLDLPMLTVGIKSYTGTVQSNLIVYQQCRELESFKEHTNILVVDDLVDTGDTLHYVKQELCGRFNQVYTAVLYQKDNTLFKPDFHVTEEPGTKWLVFPWES